MSMIEKGFEERFLELVIFCMCWGVREKEADEYIKRLKRDE